MWCRAVCVQLCSLFTVLERGTWTTSNHRSVGIFGYLCLSLSRFVGVRLCACAVRVHVRWCLLQLRWWSRVATEKNRGTWTMPCRSSLMPKMSAKNGGDVATMQPCKSHCDWQFACRTVLHPFALVCQRISLGWSFEFPNHYSWPLRIYSPWFDAKSCGESNHIFRAKINFWFRWTHSSIGNACVWALASPRNSHRCHRVQLCVECTPIALIIRVIMRFHKSSQTRSPPQIEKSWEPKNHSRNLTSPGYPNLAQYTYTWIASHNINRRRNTMALVYCTRHKSNICWS